MFAVIVEGTQFYGLPGQLSNAEPVVSYKTRRRRKGSGKKVVSDKWYVISGRL
jgi:hypothetical protein